MAEYDIGDGIELSATFKLSGVPTDTTAVLKVLKPSGTVSTPALSNTPGSGIYKATVIPAVNEHGTWWYRFSGTGTVQATTEKSFTVKRRKVPDA